MDKMIEVYVPFLLVMMSWNAADPAGTMEVSHRLLIDQPTCMAAGQELDRMVAKAELPEGIVMTWKCAEQVREIEVFLPENSSN
jgi:hypothetical protein